MDERNLAQQFLAQSSTAKGGKHIRRGKSIGPAKMLSSLSRVMCVETMLGRNRPRRTEWHELIECSDAALF